MKKALIYALALALALSLTACGQPNAEQPTDPAPGTSTPEPIAAPEPIKGTAPEPEPEQTPAAPVETEDTQPPEETESQEDEVQLFTEVNETVYATGTVNLRSGPSTEDEKVGSLNKSDSVTRTGIGTGDYSSWSKVKLSDGSEVYVASKYLTTTKPVSQSSSKPSGGSSGGQQPVGSGQESNNKYNAEDNDPILSQIVGGNSEAWRPYEGMTPEEREAAIKADQEATQKIVDGITGSFG